MSHNVRNIKQHYWASPKLPQLTIRSTFNSLQGYKAHSHEELSIGFILEGATCLSIEGQAVLLQAGDSVFIEPHKVHACDPVAEQARSYHMLYLDSGWCCDVLSSLYGREVTGFRCQTLVRKNPVENQVKTLLGLINTLKIKEDSEKGSENNIENESVNESQKASELEGEASERVTDDIDTLLFSLVSTYCEPLAAINDNAASNQEGLPAQIRSRLLSNLCAPLPIKNLADELGRSQETLIRSFKRYYGTTPKSFLNNYRIEAAKRLLKTGMSVADVAADLGYADQSQLHRAFVSYTASTPKQYQQLNVNFRQ